MKPALVVFSLALILYGTLLPRLYTPDDLQYAAVIRTAATGEPVYHPVGGPAFPASEQETDVPVNPRYALDWPTSVGAVRLARSLGLSDEIDAILAIRVLMGAVGVTFFFLTVLRISRRFSVAAVTAGCLATSLVYWTYSTHLDESIAMLAFTCIALFFLARQVTHATPRSHDPLVPLFLGLASLYNFTALVTAVPVALLWAVTRGRVSTRRRMLYLGQFALIYSATAATGVIGSLLATGDGSKLVSWSYWKSSLFLGRPEYGFHPLRDAFDAGADFLRALVSYPPVGGDTTLREYFASAALAPRIGAVLFYGMVGLLALAPLVMLLRKRSEHADEMHLVAFGLGWFAVSVLFAWWWDPTYVKYLLLPVLSWCFLFALALSRATEQKDRRLPLKLTIAVTAVAALFALNLVTIFLPQRSKGANEWLAAARELRHSRVDSLFVSAGRHPLDFYITYFAHRDVVSSGLLRYANGTETQVARVISEHVRQHRRSGGPIYVYGLASVSSGERQVLLRLLPGAGLRPVWRFHELTVYVRTPSASG